MRVQRLFDRCRRKAPRSEGRSQSPWPTPPLDCGGICAFAAALASCSLEGKSGGECTDAAVVQETSLGSALAPAQRQVVIEAVAHRSQFRRLI